VSAGGKGTTVKPERPDQPVEESKVPEDRVRRGRPSMDTRSVGPGRAAIETELLVLADLLESLRPFPPESRYRILGSLDVFYGRPK
jgi:hypothetical protein